MIFLPGIRAMDNLHPLVVHFPIALLNCFLLMELLSVIFKSERLKYVASWFLVLGTLGAIATVFAGFDAAKGVPHSGALHSIMERHENFGLVVLVLAVVLLLWRLVKRAKFTRRGQLIHLGLALVMLIVMAYGADLGGMMVYKYGVGGTAVTLPTDDHDHGAHDHGASEAPAEVTPPAPATNETTEASDPTETTPEATGNAKVPPAKTDTTPATTDGHTDHTH